MERPPRKVFVLTILVVCSGGVLCTLVFFLTSLAPPPRIPLPDPNGYDDLVRAGGMVKGSDPTDSLSLEELERFLRSEGPEDSLRQAARALESYILANSRAFELARVGLGREPGDDNPSPKVPNVLRDSNPGRLRSGQSRRVDWESSQIRTVQARGLHSIYAPDSWSGARTGEAASSLA